jgi:hypothetical protein
MQSRLLSGLRRSGLLLTAMCACWVMGCGAQKPEQLLQKSIDAEKSAQAAHQRADAKAAQRAADDARRAVDQLTALLEKEPGREKLHQLLGQAQTAERSARVYSERADEERQRREKLGGLKVRAYQKTRSVLLTTVLPQMALAAEKAAERGTNELSVTEKPLAASAWKMAQLVGNRTALPDGSPDWAGTAADLRNWSTNQPMEFRAFLGLALVSLGRSDFALAEFESVDVNHLHTTNALQIYHGGRAILFATEGWNHLAAPEVEAFCKHAEFSDGAVDGHQMLAAFHIFTAYEALKKGQLVKMDAEIAASLRAWPDNPWAVFLTGEKLAANGEWEKAADSLEAKAAGTEDAWLARRLAQRARDLRDGKGSTKALVFDARFLLEVLPRITVSAAKKSESAKKVGAVLDEAKTFAEELRQKLPLLGTQPASGSSRSETGQ